MNFVNSSYELTLLKKIITYFRQHNPDLARLYRSKVSRISRFLKYAPGRIGGGGRGRDVILVVFKKI